MKLIGCVSFFEDESNLMEKALSSLSGADEVIAIDGPYSDWPHEGVERSSESLLSLIRSFPNVRLVESTGTYPHQVDKRNGYFLGDEGDWYIVVDADEELRFSGNMNWTGLRALLRSLPKNVSWLEIPVIVRPDLPPHEGCYYMGRRIFKHISGIHYEKHHGYLWDGFGNRTALSDGDRHETPWRGARSDRLHIYHNKHDREQQRLDKQSYFYQTRRHP